MLCVRKFGLREIGFPGARVHLLLIPPVHLQTCCNVLPADEGYWGRVLSQRYRQDRGSALTLRFERGAQGHIDLTPGRAGILESSWGGAR